MFLGRLKKVAIIKLSALLKILEIYHVTLPTAKSWFNKGNVAGEISSLFKRFERLLEDFLDESGRKAGPSKLRIEIGSSWVFSDNSYEIEWKRGGPLGIEIAPEKSGVLMYEPIT